MPHVGTRQCTDQQRQLPSAAPLCNSGQEVFSALVLTCPAPGQRSCGVPLSDRDSPRFTVRSGTAVGLPTRGLTGGLSPDGVVQVRPGSRWEQAHRAEYVGQRLRPSGGVAARVAAQGQAGQRFNDLRRETGAFGQPLKATLDALAQTGLVSRHVISETSPPSVIYSLTPTARDLFPVLSSLARWHRTSGANGTETRD